MRILLFANGDLPDPEAARARVRPDDYILCADGGAHHALALGLTPDRVIGDLDSLDPALLARLQAQGVSFEQHPVDKDATDLELALEAARQLGAEEVLLLGALGGRLDQQLANLALLASPAFAGLRLSLGHGLFFALGGYVMGMYLMRQIGRDGNYQSDLPDFMRPDEDDQTEEDN